MEMKEEKYPQIGGGLTIIIQRRCRVPRGVTETDTIWVGKRFDSPTAAFVILFKVSEFGRCMRKHVE